MLKGIGQSTDAMQMHSYILQTALPMSVPVCTAKLLTARLQKLKSLMSYFCQPASPADKRKFKFTYYRHVIVQFSLRIRIQSQLRKQHLVNFTLLYINYNPPDCFLMARAPPKSKIFC